MIPHYKTTSAKQSFLKEPYRVFPLRESGSNTVTINKFVMIQKNKGLKKKRERERENTSKGSFLCIQRLTLEFPAGHSGNKSN